MPAYIKQIIGACVGVVAALVILYMGFWKGVLVIALGLIGWWLAGERKTPQWIVRLAEKIKNQNSGSDM